MISINTIGLLQLFNSECPKDKRLTQTQNEINIRKCRRRVNCGIQRDCRKGLPQPRYAKEGTWEGFHQQQSDSPSINASRIRKQKKSTLFLQCQVIKIVMTPSNFELAMDAVFLIGNNIVISFITNHNRIGIYNQSK